MKQNMAEIKPGRLIVKALLCVVIIFYLIAAVFFLIDEAKDKAHFESRENYLKNCDRDYYNRNFSSLYSYLTLYDLYGEEYDLYWEAVDGYWDFLAYRLCEGAAANVPDAAAGERMEAYRETVVQNAAHCRNASNQRLLDGYRDAVLAGQGR